MRPLAGNVGHVGFHHELKGGHAEPPGYDVLKQRKLHGWRQCLYLPGLPLLLPPQSLWRTGVLAIRVLTFSCSVHPLPLSDRERPQKVRRAYALTPPEENNDTHPAR